MAAPIGNTNAEKWTKDKSEKLLLDAIDLSNQKETFKINQIQVER